MSFGGQLVARCTSVVCNTHTQRGEAVVRKWQFPVGLLLLCLDNAPSDRQQTSTRGIPQTSPQLERHPPEGETVIITTIIIVTLRDSGAPQGGAWMSVMRASLQAVSALHESQHDVGPCAYLRAREAAQRRTHRKADSRRGRRQTRVSDSWVCQEHGGEWPCHNGRWRARRTVCPRSRTVARAHRASLDACHKHVSQNGLSHKGYEQLCDDFMRSCKYRRTNCEKKSFLWSRRCEACEESEARIT